jgi:polyisoprenoid-binding protein YceI
MKKIIIPLLLFAVTAYVSAQEQSWTLDKNHAKLGFVVTHMMISDVEGQFNTFDIILHSDKSDFTDAKIELTADINSVNTDVEMRDNDLKSDKYFDAGKYPVLTFKSISMTLVGDKKYQLTGNLTMHGITKPVKLDVNLRGPVENPYSKKLTAGFVITGTLNRSDFQVGSPSEAFVSNEVRIVASGEFIKE